MVKKVKILKIRVEIIKVWAKRSIFFYSINIVLPTPSHSDEPIDHLIRNVQTEQSVRLNVIRDDFR